jgi:hypothetical protein
MNLFEIEAALVFLRLSFDFDGPVFGNIFNLTSGDAILIKNPRIS